MQHLCLLHGCPVLEELLGFPFNKCFKATVTVRLSMAITELQSAFICHRDDEETLVWVHKKLVGVEVGSWRWRNELCWVF